MRQKLVVIRKDNEQFLLLVSSNEAAREAVKAYPGAAAVMLKLQNEIDWGFRERFKLANKVKMSQNHVEMDMLLTWLKEKHKYHKKVTYLEIGSFAGESLFYFAQIFPRDSEFVLVDLGDNETARANLMEVIKYVTETYGHKIELVTGDTTNPDTLARVKEVRDNYNLCFVDADHSFDFAINDFEKFGPLAETVFLHDISRQTVDRTKEKYGEFRPEVGHLWLGIKSVLKQEHWHEIVDHVGVLKARGFGIVKGGKF